MSETTPWFGRRPRGADNDMPNAPRNRTLIAYSGPTSLKEIRGRNKLYLRNFEYFIRHGGVVCAPNFDNVLVLTDSVAQHYRPLIQQLFPSPCSVQVLLRQNICYDMESVRTVFRTINLTTYDHFVYVNCGMTGPQLPQTTSTATSRHGHPQLWTEELTSHLNDRVRMVGLTINCAIGPHVQSFVYALDRMGMEIVEQSDALFNCTIEDLPGKKLRPGRSWSDIKNLVGRYEIGMSRAILTAGYSIAGILPNETIVSPSTASSCSLNDPWFRKRIRQLYHGRLPFWNEHCFGSLLALSQMRLLVKSTTVNR